MNQLNSSARRDTSIGLADLTPFDQSKLGERVTIHTGFLGLGQTRSEWQQQYDLPMQTNCHWNPSPSNPQQTIGGAGLCDGAQLAIIKVSRTVG